MTIVRCLLLSLSTTLGCSLLADVINFDTFYIRNQNGSYTGNTWDANLVNTLKENPAGDGFSVTTYSGQKVGYGTNAFDQWFVNKLESISFTIDPITTDKTPYLNLWVTDGLGKYAILAVDPNLNTVNFAGNILQAGLYEYEGKTGTADQKKAAASWLFKDGQSPNFTASNGYFSSVFHLSDLKDTIRFDDPYSYSSAYVGSGAPRGDYGFNLIFGDSAANYVGTVGISNLKVTYDGKVYSAANSVPDSGSTFMGTLFAVGLLSWITRRRKS